jgi:glycosyltransferase involved in cell wall biosynthesis
MKICHITTVHPVKDARIFHRMCRPLAQRRHRVTLVAPESFVAEAYLRPSASNPQLGATPRLKRGLVALRAALADESDLYHFHDPEFIPLAICLKALRPRAAVVYDVHEDYPSMMRDKYWLPHWSRPAAALGARWANRAAAALLDGIVVADQGVAADFRGAARKLIVHYNFPDLDVFRPDGREAKAARADLVYLGGISERAGTFVLFEALKLLARGGLRPSVRLAGYTDGEQGRAALESALRRDGLMELVRFDGRLPHDEVPAWLRAGRVGLVLLQPVPKFMKNIPSKMFEYWACGLPVLASDLPPARQFLTPGKNGFLFSPTSAADLAERIAYLIRHPASARALGAAGRRMIETRWNNERQIDELIAFYGRLIERFRGRRSSRARGSIATKDLPAPADLPER